MIQNKHEESKTVSSLPFQEKVAQTEQKVQFFHSLHIWLTKLESITGYQVGQFKIARQLNNKKKKTTSSHFQSLALLLLLWSLKLWSDIDCIANQQVLLINSGK